MKEVHLKRGKEKAVTHRHPWVFSGAIEVLKGNPVTGDTIRLVAHDGVSLGYGMFNASSRVAVRVLEFTDTLLDPITSEWWKARLRSSVEARTQLLSTSETNACRLVFAEADFLPGFIVDKYADFISVQIHSSGIERVKSVLIEELVHLLHPKGIYERSDLKSREHEGLPDNNGVLYGDAPPEWVKIRENGIHYNVNIAEGQKSGFYCDQRDNRQKAALHARGKKVLDCFSYSGGFTLNAFRNGAKSICSVDSSAMALASLQQNILLNGFNAENHIAIQSDVNKQLKKFADEGEKFDLIILDPPKYAPSRSALDKAARAYKDLNRRALQLLENGGVLATFSCSGAMDIETFKQVIAWAALDAGKDLQIIDQFSQPEDHPVRLSFPEGEYLKGLLCRVV